MRVTLVISSLSAGGAERVMSIMANYWAGNEWHITLVTLSKADTDFYTIHPGVTRIGLDMLANSNSPMDAIRNNVRSIWRLRHVILRSRPDAVISFMDKMNVSTCMALLGTGIQLIISERTDPAHHRVGRLWEMMRKMAYPIANAVVVQSETVKRWIEHHTPCSRIVVIPNPVLPPPIVNADSLGLHSILNITASSKIIASMGRLGHEKGFDLLIEAFAKIVPDSPGWHLAIIGEGPERQNLEDLVARFGIGSRVHFLGRLNSPQEFLRQADLFVMSSRYEGFPNALCEAMSCGLPVVSTDCPSGPREIIRDGVDGVLIPPNSSKELADAMQRLIADEAERKRLSENSHQILERFSLPSVMSMWEDTITLPN